MICVFCFLLYVFIHFLKTECFEKQTQLSFHTLEWERNIGYKIVMLSELRQCAGLHRGEK